MSLSHTLPIGQVVFVPREEITLRDSTDKERAFHAAMDEFSSGKAASKQTTPYGLQVSPHYLRESRRQRDSGPGLS